MEDSSCQVSDFPTVCRAATRTARSLFGSQVFGWDPGQIGTCRHHTSLCWERQPPLSSLSLCPEPLLVLGSSERVRKWQAGRVEAWALCLLGFWEGSQWFAKNSPKSWLWPPGGQRCLSLPLPQQGIWRQALHISCGQHGMGMGLGPGS